MKKLILAIMLMSCLPAQAKTEAQLNYEMDVVVAQMKTASRNGEAKRLCFLSGRFIEMLSAQFERQKTANVQDLVQKATLIFESKCRD